MPQPQRPSPRSAGVGLAAVAALLAIVVIASVASTDPEDGASSTTTIDFSARTATTTSVADTTGRPVGTPDANPAPGWWQLAPPDGAVASGPIAVDAGGFIVLLDDAGTDPSAASQPRTIGWRYGAGGWVAMPGPVTGGTVSPAAVWTGSELLAVGGDAAAWSPVSDAWRPIDGGTVVDWGTFSALTAVATDDRIVTIGSRTTDPGGQPIAVAMTRDLVCCDLLAGPPVDVSTAQATWTGREVILIGIDAASGADSPGRVVAAALDPDRGIWRRLPPPPIGDTREVATAWLDGALVAIGDDGTAAAWEATTGWRRLPDAPVADAGCRVRLIATSEGALASGCGRMALYSPVADRWIDVVTPTRTAGWRASPCIPSLRNGDERTVYLWCDGDRSPRFWRLDVAGLEAAGYGPDTTDRPWSLYPNPTLDAMSGTAMVWTGDELVAFCGHGRASGCANGWGLDPNTGAIRRIAASGDGHLQTVVWAGSELVVVRGITSAYDPFSVEWRTTTPSPTIRMEPVATWTGSEIIFYGSPVESSIAGTTYDPVTGTWGNVNPSPLEPAIGQVVAWSGSELYAVGGSTFASDGVVASTDGAAYDPRTGQWRILPPIPATGVDGETLTDTVGDWVHGGLIIVGRTGRDLAAFTYSSATDTWRTLRAPVPTDERASGVSPFGATPHGAELAVGFSGPTGAPTIGFYDPIRDSWRFRTATPTPSPDSDLVSGEFDDRTRFVAYRSADGVVVVSDDGR